MLLTFWFILLLFLRLLRKETQQTALQSFLVLCQPVLLPSIIEYCGIKIVTSHAAIEEFHDIDIIGCLFELERSTVYHELFKLDRITFGQVFKRNLDLLLLDGGVFFIFASARESLPWKITLQ